MSWMSETGVLAAVGEVMAAGMFEERNQSWAKRFARGLRRYLDAAALPEVNPEKAFYPSETGDIWGGVADQAVGYSFSYSIRVDFEALGRKLETVEASNWYQRGQIASDLHYVTDGEIPQRFCIGGGAYTHSIPDFESLLASGLCGVRARLEAGRSAAGDDAEKSDWLEAVDEVLAACERYVNRAAELLRRKGAPERLCQVFEHDIWHGAHDFYAGLALFNFFWYLDGADSVGRFDSYLAGCYSLAPVARADAEKWLLELWYNFDRRDGWHLVLGGHSAPGVSAYSELSEIALATIGTYRRPNAGILVSDDMPEAFWEIVFDNFARGGVNPALYNEAGYHKHLAEHAHLGEDNPDGYKIAYGGCTEMMFSGCSNVGSIDAGLNVLEVLDATVGEYLVYAKDWADFLARFEADVMRQLALLFRSLGQSQRNMALCRPQLVRSLLIADCLTRAADFNAGGARYNGSVINFAGLSNTFNALWAIRRCFEGGLPFGVEKLARMLAADFAGFESERQVLEALPKFGNGEAGLDAMASDLAGKFFRFVNAQRIVRGDGYAVPGVIMFVTYEMYGLGTGATADGRGAAAPLGDSVGAVQGTDGNGPTALLQSCAALPQEHGVGTLVLNLRLDAELVKTPEGRERLKALIRTYFDAGGLQVQISLADTAVLEAAMAEPDKYPQLMVRIGGYSEYFRNLSDGLKREVIKRTILK